MTHGLLRLWTNRKEVETGCEVGEWRCGVCLPAVLESKLGEVDEVSNPCTEHEWYEPGKGKPMCGWDRYTEEEQKHVEYGCSEPCSESCLSCWVSYALYLEDHLDRFYALAKEVVHIS